jgi:SAM-dependent methyltransferase
MLKSTSYHADVYEVIYKDKPYAKEALRIHNLITQFSPFKVQHLLELACGTGNHSRNLSRYGYSITATDINKDMVRVASNKLSVVPKLKVMQMDMLRFAKFEKPFDVIVCLFDSIGFVQTNENIISVFKNVRNNLRKEGLFIFEFWNAGAMLSSHEKMRVRKWTKEDIKIVRKSRTDLDYHNQLCRVNYEISVYKNSKCIQKLTERHSNRFFLPQEMNSFLVSAGLTPLALFDGYSSKKKITEASWHTLCLAQRK